MRVRYTPRAFAELEDIFAYIANHSPLGGRKVKSRVHAVIELIAAHPRYTIPISRSTHARSAATLSAIRAQALEKRAAS